MWSQVVSFYQDGIFNMCVNQLVNHVDKLEIMSDGNGNQIIVRVGKGSDKPLDPGHQHKADYRTI